MWQFKGDIMESNMKVFSEQNDTQQKISNWDFIKLLLFTSHSNIEQKLDLIMPFMNIKKSNNDSDDYMFTHDGKDYSFSLFSDWDLQEFDKKNLKSIKNRKKMMFRELKLVCSMDLVDPKVIIGNSDIGIFSLLIEFRNKDTTKIIDYSNNIVMDKESYYEAFDFHDINTVSKSDLYNIYYVVNKLDQFDYIFEYLIFWDLIKKDLSKHKEFKFLGDKYDKSGINLNNYCLFGDNYDGLFFTECDGNRKYDSLKNEIDCFTIDPSKTSRYIRYDKDEKVYVCKDKSFGSFKFDLLSDICVNEDIKRKLLSPNRFRKCHFGSIDVIKGLQEEERNMAVLSTGTFKTNEKDSFLHSWVEFNDNIVIDYTHNIIMDKEKYYRLYEIEVINKLSFDEMLEISDIMKKFDFSCDRLTFHCFGQEVMQDLKRNEKLLVKSKE